MLAQSNHGRRRNPLTQTQTGHRCKQGYTLCYNNAQNRCPKDVKNEEIQKPVLTGNGNRVTKRACSCECATPTDALANI
eukprot:11206404-Lingulodinium_polyedra.AAC.1